MSRVCSSTEIIVSVIFKIRDRNKFLTHSQFGLDVARPRHPAALEQALSLQPLKMKQGTFLLLKPLYKQDYIFWLAV